MELKKDAVPVTYAHRRVAKALKPRLKETLDGMEQLDAKEYQYAVVRFLQKPPEDTGEFVCVPHSWIRLRRVGNEQSIVVAYPNEPPSVTPRRVKDREQPSEKWALYVVVVKLETYTYEDAELYILEKKYGIAAEDLCTSVGNRNTSLKRSRALESQCKQRVERTNEGSTPNKISAEYTSNVQAKSKAFVYPYLQRISNYCKDSENDCENIVKKPFHISREFLNSMKQHLLKSSNQNPFINTNNNTEIPKVSEVDQDNSQVLPTGKDSEESSIAEPPQLSHVSQGSEIQPMIFDEPEGNEDTVEVSLTRDDDSDRSGSPGVSTEETAQPVGHPTDRIRTQANFIARIFDKMEESDLNSSKWILEVHKSFEQSIKLMKRIKNSSSSKKLELNKEKQDEAETPDVEVRNDVKSSSSNDKDEDEDEDGKASKKPRNLRNFALPPDYDPNDTRWTLKYRDNDPKLGLEELVPGSKVFIDSIRLAHCLRVSKDCKTLARMLLAEIFSQSALAVCSLTGAKANAFHNNGTYVRPGLDKNARVTMLKYVERHTRKKKWTSYDKQSVINSIRSRIQEIRDKHARTLD